MNTFIAIQNDETRATFLNEENMALLRECGKVREISGELNEENIASQIGDSDVYMTCWGSPRLSGTILERAPELKLLVHLGGTAAPYVSDEMFAKGIKVITGNAFFAESTAEGALACILAAQRDIPFYSHQLKSEHRWKSDSSVNRSLLGKTVGIVSYGAVAKNLVRMLQPFRVKLLIYDIRPVPEEDKKRFGITQVSLEELFSQSDIISVHTPLNKGTHGLIGEELLRLIKPDALFVNTSRGEIINQDSLISMLNKHRFRAVLDVYDGEPPTDDCGLFSAPGLIMMPHMGGPTVDLRSVIAKELITESRDYIDNSTGLKHEITAEVSANMSEH